MSASSDERRRKGGTVLRLLAAALLGGSLAGAGDRPDNLLANGGLEDKLEGWSTMSSSGQTDFEVDRRQRKRGRYSLKATKRGAFSHGCNAWTDARLPAGLGGGKVRVRLYVKAKKLGNAWVRCVFQNGAGDAIESTDLHEGALRGTFGWKRLEKELDVPVDAARVRILLNVYLGDELWLDEVEVVALALGDKRPRDESAASGRLENGDFEQGTRHWTPLIASRDELRVEADRSVRASGRCALSLRRKGVLLLPQEGVAQDVALPRRAREAALTYAARADGGARAVVVLLVFDAEGALLDSLRAESDAEGGEFEAGGLGLDLPRGAARLGIVLALEGNGEVWFDDVELEVD